jgi:hypothetical protein
MSRREIPPCRRESDGTFTRTPPGCSTFVYILSHLQDTPGNLNLLPDPGVPLAEPQQEGPLHMTQSAPFTFQTPDHRLSVTSESSGLQTIVRLFEGSKLVAEQRGMDSNVTLRAEDHTVVVKVGPFGGITQALLLPPDADPKDAQKLGQEFAAPPGTFAARVQAWGNRHPDLYAARHVVIAVGQTILGIIGFSAIFFGLLPTIPWPDVALPAIPLPQISLPSLPFPEIALPAIPLPEIALPRISPPAWLEPLFSALKYLTPIVIAIGIAVREARQRRQRRARAEQDTPAMPGVDRPNQIRA